MENNMCKVCMRKFMKALEEYMEMPLFPFTAEWRDKNKYGRCSEAKKGNQRCYDKLIKYLAGQPLAGCCD